MSQENEETLESVLINIRSVVLSSKAGVLLSHLQEDYKNFIGTYIPFEKCGYDCLEKLLQDAPTFICLKKDSRGQLYAAAVADSSTIHLTNLISKQKNNNSNQVSKPKFSKKSRSTVHKSRKKEAIYMNSNFATASKTADEKDQEIEDLKSKLEREKSMNEELSFEVNRLKTELKIANKALQSDKNNIPINNYQQSDTKEIQDLKMKLEKEMRLNKGFSSELERINSLLKNSEDSLRSEKASVKKLTEELKSLHESRDERNKKDEENSILMKEIEDLNSKLEVEKQMSKNFSSQILRLNSLVKTSQDALSAEQDTLKKLKSQIGSLKVGRKIETSPIYEYLTPASNSKEKCGSIQNLTKNDSWGGHLNFLETDAAKQLNFSDHQNPLLPILKSLEERMSEQMEKFVNQIKKQNQKLMSLEQAQSKHYQELDNKIKDCNDAMDVENIINRLLFLESKIIYASDDNMCQTKSSTPLLNSQSDDDSERSVKAATVSTMKEKIYIPPKRRYNSYSTYSYSQYRMTQNS